MFNENDSSLMADTINIRMIDFEPFDDWIAARVYPVAHRVARSAVLVCLVLFTADFIHDGWTARFSATMPFRLLAVAALLMMTVALKASVFSSRRALLTIVFGLIGQILMVYVNILAVDRLMFVPFIVLFYLFGVLILAPALGFRLYVGSAIFTVLYIGMLMDIAKRTTAEYLQVGLIILPALGFLGHAVHSQRQSARELWELARENHVKSTIDSLSRVLNRRAWYERSQAMLGPRRRGDGGCGSIAFIMLDIDHFKRVNDTWGHECGDLVIRRVAQAMVTETRNGDLVGRLGGEEFGILLANASPDDAQAAAERIRKRVENLEIEYQSQKIPVTISLGLCTGAHPDSEVDSLVRAGDRCLYQAKKGGRNQIVSAEV